MLFGRGGIAPVLREQEWWYAAMACLRPVTTARRLSDFFHPARTLLCVLCTRLELGPLFRFCVNKIGGHVHSLGGSFVCLTFAPIVITSEDGAHLSLVDWERMLSDPAKDFNESPCGSYTALSIFTKPGVVARCPPSFCREIPVLAGSLLVYFYTNHIKTWGA